MKTSRQTPKSRPQMRSAGNWVGGRGLFPCVACLTVSGGPGLVLRSGIWGPMAEGCVWGPRGVLLFLTKGRAAP